MFIKLYQDIILFFTQQSYTYEATVTIQINPPTVDAVLLRNPGGVYITALSAGKVVGAQ